MPKPAGTPAAAGKKFCGICGKPLNAYNKDDICMSHNAEDVAAYREKIKNIAKAGRDIRSFVKEFHGAGTVEEMFVEAKKPSRERKRLAEELEQYHAALRLLQVASSIFRFSMPRMLSKHPASTIRTKLPRDVLAYLMHTDLTMKPEEIQTFFGYAFLAVVPEAIERIARAYIEDEDIILAVDMVRREYGYRAELENE